MDTVTLRSHARQPTGSMAVATVTRELGIIPEIYYSNIAINPRPFSKRQRFGVSLTFILVSRSAVFVNQHF